MKISVALCTYNGEKYLSGQIDSILNQDFKYNLEIIICDDRSTDRTIEILKNYSNNYPDIFKIFINEKNLGSAKNFEKAISICDGDYIFLSDQDDIWHQDKVAKIIQKFEKNPKIDGIFTNASLINKESQIYTNLTLWDSIYFLENQLPKPVDFVDLILRNGNIVTGATLCIKKQVKNIIFPFPKDILHDEWIAKILSLKGTLSYVNQNLISYRIHENQQVGVKSINEINRIKHKKEIVLGLTSPKSFQDYKILLKKKFLKLKELNKIKSNHLNLKKKISELITKEEQELQYLHNEIKTKYALKYWLFKLIDNLLGKRKK